ncbi:hypothetical protein PL431_15250, partial [Bacteroides xylanisolvens]|uniref:hypothetical protein n=1 Tax=Bacteroides xylanisolvens TaxID=371601 RepID=UPI0023072690
IPEGKNKLKEATGSIVWEEDVFMMQNKNFNAIPQGFRLSHFNAIPQVFRLSPDFFDEMGEKIKSST